eukprot:maker-scaffold_8-snap-gene-13.59-mRNA-1 protein AED:0.01 eAED:0.01 QI:430/1/1/1/0.5/0.33/3/274/341
MDPNTRYKGFQRSNTFLNGNGDHNFNLGLTELSPAPGPQPHNTFSMTDFPALQPDELPADGELNGLPKSDLPSTFHYANHFRMNPALSKPQNFEMREEHFPALPTARAEDGRAGLSSSPRNGLIDDPTVGDINPGLGSTESMKSSYNLSTEVLEGLLNDGLNRDALLHVPDDGKSVRMKSLLKFTQSRFYKKNVVFGYSQPSRSASRGLRDISYDNSAEDFLTRTLFSFSGSKVKIKELVLTDSEYIKQKAQVQRLSDITLLVSFSSNSRDVVQVLCGLELMKRGWKLRKKDLIWFQRNEGEKDFLRYSTEASKIIRVEGVNIDLSIEDDFFSEPDLSSVL